MPFRPIYPDQPKDELEQEGSEKTKQLKREIGELRDENIMMTKNLLDLHHGYADIREDHDRVIKKLKQEKEYTLKIQQDLTVANT